MGIVQVGLILGGNFLWWKFSGWELSGGNHPGGNFPGGSFYVTTELGDWIKKLQIYLDHILFRDFLNDRSI